MTYKPRNVLVTGGAGFIGSNYIHFLLRTCSNIRVVNLDNLTYAGSMENLSNLSDDRRHTFIHGDICDRTLVCGILRTYAIDTVVHFAAESHVDRSITDPSHFIYTNLVGTYTLLDACRECWTAEQSFDHEAISSKFRFHHISTDEVYGSLDAESPPFTEATAYAPNSPYSASKAGSDHLARAYFRTYGLPVTITNCSNNYGPRQHGEKLIPTVIRNGILERPIPIYGDGSNKRDWLYVDDHCRAIQVVICEGSIGRTYNVGASNELSNLDVVKQICCLLDERLPQQAPHLRLVSFVEDRPGHDWRYAVDPSRIVAELRWRPQTDFSAGLQATVDWYVRRTAISKLGTLESAG